MANKGKAYLVKHAYILGEGKPVRTAQILIFAENTEAAKKAANETLSLQYPWYKIGSILEA